MLFKNSVRTSKRTPHFTITKINWLTLFKFNYELRQGVWGSEGVAPSILNLELDGQKVGWVLE
jgi:hypothetical protein